MENSKTARFDTRWTIEQKELFEYASQLAGYRTLSEFVLASVQDKAKKILEEHNTIIASEKDRSLFFDSLMNFPKPNQNLKKAKAKYQKVFGE